MKDTHISMPAASESVDSTNKVSMLKVDTVKGGTILTTEDMETGVAKLIRIIPNKKPRN